MGTDIPKKNVQRIAMTKDDRGVWQASVGPLEPGAYRYNFNVDGVSVIDPRSPSMSESNNNVWSLVHVPGSEFMDTTDVPHGAVAAVTYCSTSLHKVRRMHVYTPPGYELGTATFRCSICCTARATATSRGLPSDAPDSSSTTSSPRRKRTDGGGHAGWPHEPDDIRQGAPPSIGEGGLRRPRISCRISSTI